MLRLAVAIGAVFLVEQPSGSLLWEHDRLQELLELWKGVVNDASDILGNILPGFQMPALELIINYEPSEYNSQGQVGVRSGSAYSMVLLIVPALTGL